MIPSGNPVEHCTRLAIAAFAMILLSCAESHAAPVEAPAVMLQKTPPDSPERMTLARVQVLLDRAGFRPGKIDGLSGEFTQKAADRYCLSLGLPAGNQFDISGINSPFRLYSISEVDAQWIGRTSSDPEQQSQFKSLHYGSLWEAVAERFHCDLKYLRELNPGVEDIGIGSILRVPDVMEFSPQDVVNLKRLLTNSAKPLHPEPTPTPIPNSSLYSLENRPLPFDLSQSIGSPPPTVAPTQAPTATPSPAAVHEPVRRLVLDRTERLIELYEDNKLAGCFPCTPGSTKFPVPEGTWRITSNVLMPHFRWDKSVLESGVRSDNAHLLPPGPNSPVGIVWMGINRPSLGMHGTNSPDRIGRNQSSGCIRLANWDAFLLCQRINLGIQLEVR
jgi:lipoprotein-anchoring transpeptidase ErfK/SrfK